MNTQDCMQTEISKLYANKVDWRKLIYIMAVIGAIGTFVYSDVKNNRNDIIDIKSIIPVLQSDVNYIKGDIGEIKDDIKIIIQR